MRARKSKPSLDDVLLGEVLVEDLRPLIEKTVVEAMLAERNRCLAILKREVDVAIEEPQTGVSAMVRAIRRAENAIREGR